MSEQRDPLVWLDMEMTGLDPMVDVPVEVAMIITDADLHELEVYEAVIWQPDSVLDAMQPFVRKMHTDNGLLAKIRTSDVGQRDAERKLLEVLARWTKPGEGVLSGNSIHQDRKFIARYFPALDGYLHYRMLDVSTIKEVVKRWYGAERLPPKGISEHTALADARASIAELAFYRANVFRAAASS